MSIMALSPSAVPPASISDPPPPPVTLSPTSPQPNVDVPPPLTPSALPPASQSSPPVITTPPLASTQAPPPRAPPPIKPASSPPPLPVPPTPSTLPPKPSDTPKSSTPPPSDPPFLPPPSPPIAPPPSPPITPPPSPPITPPPSLPPPHTTPPPSLPPPASEPPKSPPPPPAPTPPKASPPVPSANPPTESPPPKSDPHSSPPPPGKIPPITSSPPPPPRRPPSRNSPPPPETIPPTKSPPSPRSTLPPPQPSPSQPNSSSPPLIPLVAPPNSAISPPSSKFAPNTKSNSSKNGGTNEAVVAGISVSAGIIVLSLIIFVVWCVIKRKKKASLNGRYIKPSPYGSSHRADSTSKVNSSAPLIRSGSGSGFDYSLREPGGLRHSRSWFAYEELVVATNGFSPDNLLGEGGFGYVYKGFLRDGMVIAVKQLKIGGGQGEREFKAEVETISRIHHRHLVSLVGYCVADSRRLLVYEYVSNNTLYFHLHGEGRPPINWATRVKVAAGAARGIAYLHEDCHPRIIHRDIKSSNILLNDNFDARVSDFGLAKLALDANTHVTTRVMGTFGYMAPEYASSGKLTEKSDVYSFGVVLLELITGRKPVDGSQPLGDESLVEWARPLLSHAIETAEFGSLVDPRLENNYVDAEMFRMIEAAAACVRHSATKRPRMGQVVRAFDSILPWDITNGMQMGQSEVYNSAEQSAEIRLFRKMAFGSQNYSTDYFSSDNSQVHDELVQIESRSHSHLHSENTTHILERDNQITEQDPPHLGS
ncbi:unnamed protein product [Rhodiola kirilowii]